MDVLKIGGVRCEHSTLAEIRSRITKLEEMRRLQRSVGFSPPDNTQQLHDFITTKLGACMHKKDVTLETVLAFIKSLPSMSVSEQLASYIYETFRILYHTSDTV